MMTSHSLAYAELRLILAKLLWNFDVELAAQSDHPRWIQEQKTALIWEKLPLYCELEDARAKSKVEPRIMAEL
jgi:hypothetical protein